MFNKMICFGPAMLLWLACGLANADLILSLNTGTNSQNQLLASGDLDADYSLIVSADPSFSLPGNMFVANTLDGFPFFPGGWMSNGPLSNWLVPYTNGQISSISVSPTGAYIYRTTFDLTNYDASTASITGKWAADENGTDILLNGVSTNQTTANPGFTAFADFAIASGFVSGINTLDFVTFQNDQLTGNPIGLRVEGQLTALAQVPEPSSMLLFLSGSLALWAHRKRRIGDRLR